MTPIKKEEFIKVIQLSFQRKGGDIVCNLCDARFATMEDFINHLLRQHKNDPLPEIKKKDEKRKCPFREYQGITGLEGLQPYCSFGGHPCHCPVIDMKSLDPIDCDDLDKEQLKVAVAAKRKESR